MMVCIGQSAYDITYVIHEDLVENQKYRIYETMECVGAPATNAASLCARWKEDVVLLSRVGKDVYGEKVITDLKEQGVDTSLIAQLEGFKTPVSTIIAHAETGSRTIFNCPGVFKEHIFHFPSTCDVLLLDGHEIEASLDALQRYPQAISMLDAGTWKEETKELAQRVDHLVCSQDFAYQYTGIKMSIHDRDSMEQTFACLQALNKGQLVVTMGEDGLCYKKDGKVCYMEAFPVKAVDTTGAGDIFHGAYAYGLKKGWSLETILKVASYTAALSTTKLGGNTAIPSWEEVSRNITIE